MCRSIKMMEYKQELLPLAYKQATSVIRTIEELAITAKMDSDAKDNLIVKLARDKAEKTGKPYTAHLNGMEWYVESLITKSQLSKKELLQEEYNELLPANSSFDELVRML